MSIRPEGITHPSIDELLATTESKYSLVIYAARRARQITGYYAMTGDYALQYVGPLVETHPQEKPMSIAMREIHSGMLVASTEEPGEEPIVETILPPEPELVAIDTNDLTEMIVETDVTGETPAE